MRVRRLQCDEIWSFVGAKQKHVRPERSAEGWGVEMKCERNVLPKRFQLDPFGFHTGACSDARSLCRVYPDASLFPLPIPTHVRGLIVPPEENEQQQERGGK